MKFHNPRDPRLKGAGLYEVMKEGDDTKGRCLHAVS